MWKDILKLDWMEEARDLLLEFDSDMLDYLERMTNQEKEEHAEVIHSIDIFLEDVNARLEAGGTGDLPFLKNHFDAMKRAITATYNDNIEAVENFAAVIEIHMKMVKNVNLTPEEQQLNILGALVSSKETLGIIPKIGDDDLGQPTLDIEKVDALIRMGMTGGEQ